MKKGKKKNGAKKHANGQQTSTTPAAAGSTPVHTTHHSPINRTRTKLPTKRKQLRHDANPAFSLEDEYEIVVEMPRNHHRSADRGGYRGRGGIGHASRGNRNRGMLYIEAKLTSSESWVYDERGGHEYE